MNHAQDTSLSTPQSNRRLNWLRGLLCRFCNSLERSRTRYLLGQLDDRQLSDLGISHAERINELDKPFWR
ncbi:DUF1127 domain-containing protein [Pseudomonas sp. SDO5532_S415]|jgi:uncharacterized protein YjiS (DUF1127 family)|uniref:DUF1127 domain-containing protein n=1 Tax=unclassified Pseudomonas TaxID=196821 RepID=UPI000BA3AA8B|nr:MULTISPECIES: DUF1127 domain-containing protein [unclassified Pseudomonas]